MMVEHPNWKPWYRRCAEYEGTRLILDDLYDPNGINPSGKKWAVYALGMDGEKIIDYRGVFYHGHDLDEATAAFHAAEVELLGVPA